MHLLHLVRRVCSDLCMLASHRQKNTRVFASGVLLALVFIFFFCFMGIYGSFPESDQGNKIPYNDYWLVSRGYDSPSVKSFHDEAVFYTYVTSQQAAGRSLCLLSKNTEFDVYVDGEMTYSFHPDSPAIYGKFYGTYPHQIELSSVDDVSEIMIVADTIDGSTGSFTDITLQSGTSFVTDIFRVSMFPYCISIVIAFMGLALVIGGLTILKNASAGKEIAAMGLFALDSGIWTACSSGIVGMVLGNPVTMHFVNYISLIVLPAIAVMFVYLLTGKRYQLFSNTIIIITLFTLIFDIVMTVTGLSTYHDLLLTTHAECILVVIYSFLSIFKSIKSGQETLSTRVTVMGAFIAVVLGGLIDLMRYLAGNTGLDSAYYFRLGLMAFIFIMGIHEVYALMVYRKYESEAEELSKIAYTDALTGLKNRMAFTDKEDIYSMKPQGAGIVIQLDINNLKKVNDTYGHKEGDKHIKAAADVINQSFGQIGDCYRTGGDEFIVVVENLKHQSDFETARDKFIKLIDEYNEKEKPRVKLEIPYGVEEYDLKSKDVEKALRLADGKMYDMKKQMKEN